MSQVFRKLPNAHRMLQRIPKETRSTFTLVQIQALETALVPRTHAIDMRLSLPVLGKGAYMVLSAGPNRRSRPRILPQNRQEQSPEALSAALSSVINISQAFRNCPNAFRVLQRMPREVSTTFIAEQIQAIEAALMPRTHVIDIHLSMPFLGKGAYFVFAAGPNRRAHYRSLQNRNPLVMPAVFASIAISTVSLIGLVNLKASQIVAEPDPVFSAEEAFHPTIVPFKKTQEECEASFREWKDGQCFDKDHDPVF